MKTNSTPFYYLRYLFIAALSLVVFSTGKAQTNSDCGSVETFYQTFGNATTGKTEIKKFYQFAQTFVTIGTLPDVTNTAAPNSAYNSKTKLLYSCPGTTGLTNTLFVFDPAKDFVKVGEIKLESPTSTFSNTLFAKGDTIGYINGSTMIMINVGSLDFSTYTTYTLTKPSQYSEITIFGSNPGCSDYSLVGDYVYGVKNIGATIYRVNTKTGIVESKSAALSGQITSQPAMTGSWGATWHDVKGNFYGFNNGSGEIFRIDDIKNHYDDATLNFYRIFTSEPSNQNDGFGCELIYDLMDWDGDGVINALDLDNDNDGILDTEEGYLGLSPDGDADNDGIVNYLDTNDPSLPTFVDVNSDGINDYFDSDLDSVPNSYDADSDNDGSSDANEAYNAIVDTNSDGTYGGVITSADVNVYGLVTAAGLSDDGKSYSVSQSTNKNIITSLKIAISDPTAKRVNNDGSTTFTGITTATSTTTFSTTGVPDFSSDDAKDITSDLTYQWQVKESDTWSDVLNAGTYKGAKTNSLTITGVDFTYDNYEYRIVVSHTDKIDPEISSAATLNVNAALTKVSINGSISENIAGTIIDNQLGYPLSTELILTQAPDAGYIFKRWILNGLNAIANADKTLSVTINGDTKVEAVFEKEFTTGNNNIVNEISYRIDGNNVSLIGLNELATVNVYDVLGKLKYQYNDINNNESFAVNNSGLYILEIITKDQKLKLKLMLN